jgi:hypothetical protein
VPNDDDDDDYKIIINIPNVYYFSVGRDSSVGIATRYGLESPGERIPVRSRFSAPVQTGPGAHPASRGVKRQGRGANHLHPSSAKVKGIMQLYLYSPSGPSWPVLGRTLPLPFTFSAFPFNLQFVSPTFPRCKKFSLVRSPVRPV